MHTCNFNDSVNTVFYSWRDDLLWVIKEIFLEDFREIAKPSLRNFAKIFEEMFLRYYSYIHYSNHKPQCRLLTLSIQEILGRHRPFCLVGKERYCVTPFVKGLRGFILLYNNSKSIRWDQLELLSRCKGQALLRQKPKIYSKFKSCG